MGRRFVLFAAAVGLFVCIVGSAAVVALAGNGRSLPASTVAQVERVATVVIDPSTRDGNLVVKQLSTPRAVPFPDGSLDHSFFALTGGHQPAKCTACHAVGDYRGTEPDCLACHAQDDAHAGEYGLACATCHVIEGWQFATFDHSTIGSTDCAACHTPPANHYPGQCSACHTTASWSGATFNHTFPINHEGANGDCATCHPGGETAVYTCTACHSQQEMNEEHDEESGYTGNNCVQCHADGREHDDDDDHDDDD